MNPAESTTSCAPCVYRQGDPGESSFYISLEDDLMRLFGPERIQNMMDTLGIADDEPIDQKILSGAIVPARRRSNPATSAFVSTFSR